MSDSSSSTTDIEEEELLDGFIKTGMELCLLMKIAVVEESSRADVRLMNDYFFQHPTYNDIICRRRFRMRKSLFMRIVENLSAVSPFFQQLPDATGTLGFSPIQNVTASFHMLAYGTHPDALDESLRMSGRTVRDTLNEFCRCVILLFKSKYLRSPNAYDVQQRQAHHANVHNFPGMLGSLDCMHWKWEMCPNWIKGQYIGAKGCIVVFEAIASQDLWFWHGYFGSPGSLNDVNILNMSPIFNKLFMGTAPDSSFVEGGQEFRFGYYLTDGIYPEFSVFVKTLSDPSESRRKIFKKAQEKARKDIKRALGALKKTFSCSSQCINILGS